jgi:hypothetical protein
MRARNFCIRLFIYSTVIAGVLVGINWYVDLYGLFRHHNSISIYSDERTTKYLLAHRYVPDNFDGYILGPSLSANMDPSVIKDKKIYNLSMMGANITEEAAVARKALERKTPSVVIICLHPYLTHDHGMKTGMINEKEYYGAFGSVSLYKSYLLWMVRKMNLAPYKYPSKQFSSNGYNDYGVTLAKSPVEEKIAEQLTRDDAIRSEIDPIAMDEFKSLVDDLRSKNVEIITYFHPLPFPIYDKFRAQLDQYQQTMNGFLKDKATVINFNSPDYESFTKDLSNYIDHGHLSYKGQEYILNQLMK